MISSTVGVDVIVLPGTALLHVQPALVREVVQPRTAVWAGDCHPGRDVRPERKDHAVSVDEHGG